MYSQKVSKSKDNVEVVHFSVNQTFYCNGILFKIFKTGSTNPKAPKLALLNVNTKDRVSGLFRTGSRTYQGDIKQVNGDKTYFKLTFIDKDTLELEGLGKALGLDNQLDQNNPLEDPYSPLEDLVMVEGIEPYNKAISPL